MGEMSLKDIRYLANLKRTNAKEYEQILTDLTEVARDMVKVTMKIAKELEEKDGELD